MSTANEHRTSTGGTYIELCVVGTGPRGLSVLERLCANERGARSHTSVTVHVVDAASADAGAVGRSEQSRHLLMNDVTSRITIYTDEGAQLDGPIEPGPCLYDWSASLALLGGPDDYSEEILAEAKRLGPNSYPTRAFYGCYLHDAFERVVAGAPEHVTIRVHRSRAVAIADTHGVAGGPQGIRLENGTRLDHLDAVILAQGRVPARLTPHEARTASLARIHHLVYVTPADPADVDLFKIQADRPVLLRGLGPSFFDYLALFTVGRGGTYFRDGDRLVYRPSGREPRLFASSRRGVPHRARTENEKGAFGRHVPRVLTPEAIARMRGEAGDQPSSFATDLWPLIAKEIESVYYRTLFESTGRDGADDLIERYVALPDGQDPVPLLDEYGIGVSERWDWQWLTEPCLGRTFADRSEFRTWLLTYLAHDVQQARAGDASDPLTAAMDVLRDLRGEVRSAADHGGLDGASCRDDLKSWCTPLNAFLSIGPPVSRIEEMIALIDTGLLEVTGPGTKLRIDLTEPTFIAESTVVPGPPVRASALIEARLPEPDLRRTDDPLLRHMLDTDQCSPNRLPDATATNYETGGLAVTGRPYRVVDARGRAHPRRFAYGVPTDSVTGVDSVTLGDSDAIARTVLGLRPVAHVPADVRQHVIDEAGTETYGTDVVV